LEYSINDSFVSYGEAVEVSVAVAILGWRMHGLLTQAYAPKLKAVTACNRQPPKTLQIQLKG